MTTISYVANVTTRFPALSPVSMEMPDTQTCEEQARAEEHKKVARKRSLPHRSKPQAGEARQALQELLGQLKQLPPSQLQWPAKAMMDSALRTAEKHEAAHQADSSGLQTARLAVTDALLNPLGNTTLGEMLDKATDYLAFTALRDGGHQARVGQPFIRDEVNSRVAGDEFKEQMLSRVANTLTDPPAKSDKEIYEEIIKLIAEMQDAFIKPFLSAAEKMRVYYDTLAKLRDVIAKSVSYNDEKTVTIKRGDIFGAIDAMIKQFSGDAGVLHQADSQEEAQSMRDKFGSGVVSQDPKTGKWLVKIDIAQLTDMKTTSEETLEKDNTSLTAYNNFLSAVDAFLTREQTKTSKITNQLEYYNKLINNVQDTITQFFKQMSELAVNFLRI